jgi:hypothetical protein
VGVPKWECLSGRGLSGSAEVGVGLSAIQYRSACASGCVLVCDACASLLCTDHCGRRHARRRLHGQASSSGAILPIRTFPTHTHREAQRGAARHNKGMSRADENHRECMQGRGGGPAGPVPCPARTAEWPDPLLSSALHAHTRHGTGPAVAYRVGQWPPRPCIHSRWVSSARVIS